MIAIIGVAFVLWVVIISAALENGNL